MSDDCHPISPDDESFDGAWKLMDDDNEMPFFSLSFSRDEDDLLTTLVDQQEALGPEGLIPLKIDSTSLSRYSFDECDDDSFISPDTHASLSLEPEKAPSSTPATTAETSETSHQSRKRKIVTPQQRKRQVEMQQRGGSSTSYSSSSSSSVLRRVSSSASCYHHFAGRMRSCMERSETSRAQILEHFPSQQDHPVAKKRRSVQDCFRHTQTSRERILSWLR